MSFARILQSRKGRIIMVILFKVPNRLPCTYFHYITNFFYMQSNFHATRKLWGEVGGLVYGIGERDHAPRFPHHLVHYR